MRSLLWKDLVVGKWFWVAAVPIYLAQLVAMADLPPAFVLVTLAGAGFFAFLSVGIDETQGTEVLWNSLPVSRGQIVYARYFATTLGVAFGLVSSWLIAQTASGWIVSSASEPALPLGPGAYVSFALLLMTGAALFLPCYFRFGAGRGLQVFSGLVVGLLLLFSTVGSLLVLVNGGPDALARLGPPTVEQLAAIDRWLDVWGSALAAGLAALTVAGTAWSATISAQFYRARDF